MGAFAKRYVVAENPLDKIAALPPKMQTAIKSARVTNGMTREQVLMALGYPIASETPRSTCSAPKCLCRPLARTMGGRCSGDMGGVAALLDGLLRRGTRPRRSGHAGASRGGRAARSRACCRS